MDGTMTIIEELAAVLRECADDLEAELDVRHVHRERYPSIQRDYDRDMQVVHRARELLQRAQAYCG